jgi:hypothetical protein
MKFFLVLFAAFFFSGVSAQCAAPILDEGSCPSGAIVANSFSDICGVVQALPSSSLSATSACAFEFVYFLQGTYEQDNGFDQVRGVYNPGSPAEIFLPVGDYNIVIRARNLPINSGNVSSGRCILPVSIADNVPPQLCIGSQNTALPCGRGFEGWKTEHGWAVVSDNCGARRGTWNDNNMDMFCGDNPVEAHHSFTFTDFGGNTINTGNAAFQTADGSCSCDYLRPFEHFDTMVQANGDIVNYQLNANDDANAFPFNFFSGDNCWSQGFDFGVTKKSDNAKRSGPSEYCFSYLGPDKKKRDVVGPVCKGAWKRSNNWSTSTELSAAIVIDGSDTANKFRYLESPLLPFKVFYDFETGLTEPIQWDQKYSFGPFDYGYSFINFFYNCKNAACQVFNKKKRICKKGTDPRYCANYNAGPELVFSTPIPLIYYVGGAGCPSFNFDTTNWVGEGECKVTLSTAFWPDMIGYIEQVANSKKRDFEGFSEASQRFIAARNNVIGIPIEFALLNWYHGVQGEDAPIDRLAAWIRDNIEVALGFGLVTNEERKRSVVPPPPAPPADRFWYIDTINFGNTGYRYNISKILAPL